MTIIDKINEKQLNLIKWNNDVGDWGVWSWEPDNTWVKDGCLHLRMQHHTHKRGTQTIRPAS
ncbi:MAG: hypothetical protein PHO37_18590 [Kiritimatiellae bacterium]|nr:hypothetical protein [Kiritimatiellia bacterium]